MDKEERIKIGQVGVDSGTLMLIDPCYVIGDKWNEKYYKEEVCGDWHNYKQLKNSGVIFSSGLGDGIYEVYATISNKKEEGKRVKKVEIILIE